MKLVLIRRRFEVDSGALVAGSQAEAGAAGAASLHHCVPDTWSPDLKSRPG